jgi:UPF0271 protein
MKSRIFVLDASALLNLQNFVFDEQHSYITTPHVMSELRSLESKTLAENAMRFALLKLREPREETMQEIRKLVKSRNFTRMSAADLSVLALAKELKEEGKEPEVMTDDYSIQNFLKILNIPFTPIIQEGIKRVLSFVYKCPACGKSYNSAQATHCEFCGTKLVVEKRFSEK